MSFFKHMLHDVKVLLAYVYTHKGKRKKHALENSDFNNLAVS